MALSWTFAMFIPVVNIVLPAGYPSKIMYQLPLRVKDCSARGGIATLAALTKNQLKVLEKLEAASAPLGAYMLLDQLRGDGFRAPLQIYRALEVLVKNGCVHRLESLNAFVACSESHDYSYQNHLMTAFVICDNCGQVIEISDELIGRHLDDWVRKTGFVAKKAIIEFRGTCAKCMTIVA